VPPYTRAEPLAFDDVPFRVEDFTDESGQRRACERCGATDSFLDELIDDDGHKHWQCSDSDYCNSRLTIRNAQRTEIAAGVADPGVEA
jgi:alpha-D-ribose 1-methylphosphonate 5-phosphate C-P lyase